MPTEDSPIYVGIDASMRGSAVCLCDPSARLIETEFVGDISNIRGSALLAKLLETVGARPVCFVVEYPVWNGYTAVVRAAANTWIKLIEESLPRRQRHIFKVDPNVWQADAFGPKRQRFADTKTMSFAVAYDVMDKMGVRKPLDTHDEADAVCLMVHGLRIAFPAFLNDKAIRKAHGRETERHRNRRVQRCRKG